MINDRAARRHLTAARRWSVLAAAALSCAGLTVAVSTASSATPPGRQAARESAACTTANPPTISQVDAGRPFTYDVPKDRGTGPLPLILAFHGAKQTPTKIKTYSGLHTADAIVVYPYGRKIGSSSYLGWGPTDDLEAAPDIAYTLKVIAAFEKSYCIDTTRVYATGKSEGGGFAYALACSEPGMIAAIAPVSGAFYRPSRGGLDPATCGSKPLPVLDFHGQLDSVISYDDTVNPEGDQSRARPVRTTLDYPTDQGFVDEWAQRNSCTGHATTGNSNGTYRLTTWTGCTAPVEEYRLLDGGHTWPGSPVDKGKSTSGGGDDPTDETIDATADMLRFFHVTQS